MDLYQSTVDYLLTFPIFGACPEMRENLQQFASRGPRDWQLPIIGCQAAGALAEKPIWLSHAML